MVAIHSPYQSVDGADSQEEDRLDFEHTGKESLESLNIERGEHHTLQYSQGLHPRHWAFQDKTSKRGLRLLLIVVPLLLVAGGLLGLLAQTFTSSAAAKTQALNEPKRLKVAYATLLSAKDENVAKESTIYDDKYFVATRILGYQLLHDPETRTQLGAPFVVIATPNVSQAKVDRLERDGITVFRAKQEIDPPLYRKYDRNRFIGVWNKLYVWQWTQYDRVVFIDNDHILLKRLDDIFDETAAQTFPNVNNQTLVYADEEPQPTEYVFAGQHEIKQSGHHHPPTQEDFEPGWTGINYANGGFFVTKPDMKMFNYMQSILRVKDKFTPYWAEQDFLNHVFNPAGNLPVKMLPPLWSLHRPTIEDTRESVGIHALHEKWWNVWQSKEMQEKMQAIRWKMEGFYTAWDTYIKP